MRQNIQAWGDEHVESLLQVLMTWIDQGETTVKCGRPIECTLLVKDFD